MSSNEREALRQLEAAVRDVWGDPENCEDCAAVDAFEDEGSVCAVHASQSLWLAMMAAWEVLGPCPCGHARSRHHDVDSTACRDCGCQAFKLPLLDAAPEPETPDHRTALRRRVEQLHGYVSAGPRAEDEFMLSTPGDGRLVRRVDVLALLDAAPEPETPDRTLRDWFAAKRADYLNSIRRAEPETPPTCGTCGWNEPNWPGQIRCFQPKLAGLPSAFKPDLRAREFTCHLHQPHPPEGGDRP